MIFMSRFDLSDVYNRPVNRTVNMSKDVINYIHILTLHHQQQQQLLQMHQEQQIKLMENKPIEPI